MLNQQDLIQKASLFNTYVNQRLALIDVFGLDFTDITIIDPDDRLYSNIIDHLDDLGDDNEAVFYVSVLNNCDERAKEWLFNLFDGFAEEIINAWHLDNRYSLEDDFSLVFYRDDAALLICKLIIPNLDKYQDKATDDFNYVIKKIYNECFFVSYGDEEKDGLIESSKTTMEQKYGHRLKKT